MNQITRIKAAVVEITITIKVTIKIKEITIKDKAITKETTIKGKAITKETTIKGKDKGKVRGRDKDRETIITREAITKDKEARLVLVLSANPKVTTLILATVKNSFVVLTMAVAD